MFSKIGTRRVIAGATLGGATLMATSMTWGASHSDAPTIKQDPQANLTDVYAFVGTRYDDPSEEVLNIVANVRPFSEPGDGPHYDRFADDARYSLHVADPATGATIVRYDFRFSAVDAIDKNPNTILSFGLGSDAGSIIDLGDGQQNFVQTYTVTKALGRRHRGPVIGNGIVAVPNVGVNVTPFYNDAEGRAISGATSFEELDRYTQQAIVDATNGSETFFAGPREDGFFADIPGTFDLLNARILDNNGTLLDGFGQDGNGVDGFQGFNVLAFAIQIPLSELPQLPYTDVFFGEQMGIGAYASVSRPQSRLLRRDGTRLARGRWIQVNRMGNPLFNEALVPLSDKDRFNRTSPEGDESFATFASNPELAGLINLLYNQTFATSGREDLVGIFIPDVLRVNTTTGPVRLAGQANFSRLGFIGGDLTGGVSSGWPNGRRFGDDVIDIALTAIASGPAYDAITLVGDNVAANDQLYNQVFPYAGTPNSGTNNSKDSPAPAMMSGDLNADGAVNELDVLLLLREVDASGN